mgnify:CR=1 FL=1
MYRRKAIEKIHFEVGKYISERKIDEVVVVGKEAKAIVEAIEKSGNKAITTHCFESNCEAVSYIKESFKEEIVFSILSSMSAILNSLI